MVILIRPYSEIYNSPYFCAITETQFTVHLSTFSCHISGLMTHPDRDHTTLWHAVARLQISSHV